MSRLTSTIASAWMLLRFAAARISSGDGGLVQAVRPLPVGAQEREEPRRALLGVDLLDQADVGALQIELVGEAAFDNVNRHGEDVKPAPMQSVGVRVRRRLGAVRGSPSSAGCCGCDSRRCAR